MSVYCITKVLDNSAHGGKELLMLVVLADYSADGGNLYPDVASLARKCSVTSRKVTVGAKKIAGHAVTMSTANNGQVPGSITSIEKPLGATNSKGVISDTNSADFLSHGAINQAHGGKAIATKIARLALAGQVIHKGNSGDYTVTKWAQTHYCKDFDALAAFAKKAGSA